MKKQIIYLQKLFYDLWNDFGSVYLLVKYSDRTAVGNRGFTEEEKKQGLVLVFNNRTNQKLDWDAEGNLSCVLAFGSRKEDVFIHHDDLVGVFSAEAGVQFLRSKIDEEAKEEQAAAPPSPEPAPKPEEGETGPKQVVSLNDFRKHRPDKK